jgi:hypothetical protein
MRRFVAATTIVFSAAAVVGGMQSPVGLARPRVLATLSGQVVDAATKEPVPNARVGVAAAEELGAPVVLADRDGRFSIPVEYGRYSITASKSGYAPTHLTATTGDRVVLRLPPGAVISGRVLDEYGDPALAARVVVETPADTAADHAYTTTTETDDRGEYRFAGLPAESYIVSVIRQRTPGPNVGNRTFRNFYPGVETADEGERLRLEAGEERSGIDFTVPADTSSSEPFSVGSLGPQQQGSSDPASGAIRGQVVSVQGSPLPFALVRVTSARNGRQSYMTRAGGDGRFEFTGLSAGSFRLLASKPGYVPGASGEAQPRAFGGNGAGRQVDLSSGEVRENVNLTLARWSALTGHVLDEYGFPVQGASIQLLQVRYERGRQQLVQTDGSNRTTDERGQYRIYAITPGTYIISAVVGSVLTADLPGYVRSYAPGTPDPSEAQIVSIGASEEVAGVDIALSRVPTARIAGQMMNAAGQPSGSGSLMLMPSEYSTTVTGVGVGARILSDGRFEFPNVSPGQYVIQSNRGRPNHWTEGEFAALRVAVNGADVDNLLIQTSNGSSITGRITFDASDTTRKQPGPGNIGLVPQPADFDLCPPGNYATADIAADWTFRIAGINGPRRLQLTRVPGGWALERILAGGADITDKPIDFGRDDQSLDDVEVVLTDRINQIRGSVMNDHAQPAAGAAIVLFSADPGRLYPGSRFMSRAVSRPDGTFVVGGLPSGTYHVATVAQIPAGGPQAWQDPAFLDSLIPSASTVTLGDGQTASVNLKLPSR